MPTLRDLMRQRQWQQEAEAATLSLAEIAERWARLECGEDPAESLVQDYLREIAVQLSKRQQLQMRLEASVVPSRGASAYGPHSRVVNPWQPLHKIQSELAAAAAGDQEAAAKLRLTDSMLRTCLRGSASQPPEGLFPMPPRPQHQGTQADMKGTDENLVLKGTEPAPHVAESRATGARSYATPPLMPEPCIVCPPTNKDDWFSVIFDAAEAFRAKEGRCPKNYTEMWVWLHANPPHSYRVTSGRDRGGEKALLLPGGSSLGKRPFKERWARYTCGTKEHKET